MARRGKTTDPKEEAGEATAVASKTSAVQPGQSTVPETAGAERAGESEALAEDKGSAGGNGTPVVDVTGAAGDDLVARKAMEAVAAAISDKDQLPVAPVGSDIVFVGVDMGAPERRRFRAMDPVAVDGTDYGVGDDVDLTESDHAELYKANVILTPWEDGSEI